MSKEEQSEKRKVQYKLAKGYISFQHYHNLLVALYDKN